MTDITTQDLVLTHEEMQAGVNSATLIQFKRVTIVILETADGAFASGVSTPWPGTQINPRFGPWKARDNARYSLQKTREKMAQRRPMEAAE
jgi:hypothetical protein